MYNYAMKNTVLLVFSPSSANSNALISGVSSYARQRKWRLHMIDKADRRTLIEAIRFFDPIGCLVGGHIDKSCDPIELPTGLAKSLPVVYLDRDPFPENRQIFCVAHDSTETGRIAAKELLDLGNDTGILIIRQFLSYMFIEDFLKGINVHLIFPCIKITAFAIDIVFTKSFRTFLFISPTGQLSSEPLDQLKLDDKKIRPCESSILHSDENLPYHGTCSVKPKCL